MFKQLRRKGEMSNINKHALLFVAALFILVLIPTAFASNIDADVVEMNNELAVDEISLPATDDVAIETVSAAYDESASDESDALEANDYENNDITAGNDAIYVDGFDGLGGSGTSGNPYHSLKNVLTSSDNLGNKIYLLPGTYDFGNSAVDLYGRDFTLNAMGDVTFTSSATLFHKYGNETLTLNGIQFKNITSSSSAILYTGSSVQGTLNLNNCSFINNKGTNLIQTSYNINVNGCIFINNEANGTSISDAGLIQNVLGSPTIYIGYSVFIGNKIRYSYMGFHPLIANAVASSEPSVILDYNFVNYNDSLNAENVVANGNLSSFSSAYIVGTVSSDVSSGDTVDLIVNFTKYDGSALNQYMPSLPVSLVPNVNAGSIPVTITNNGGKGQYTAKSGVSYTESIDVKYGDLVLNTFEFYVSDGNLLNPELTVPASMIADIGAGVNINAGHEGDGIVSFVSADESIATVDVNGIVTGISEGITTITVNIAATDTYGEDSKQVKLFVKDPADGDAVFVDGFNEPGGSGIKVDPYHSLLDVLVYENRNKEIRFLPGTYDFVNVIKLYSWSAFILAAEGDDVIFTTSLSHMFEVNGVCDVTFNGIKFKDSNVDDSVVIRTYSRDVGTLNFNNCQFVNNTGRSLIESSCNVNIKGCTFIDNKAIGNYLSNCGLIHDYGASTNTISVSYSIFINNEISYNNNGYNPIIVDWNNGNGPAVIFNYNFVNNNNALNNNAIAYHASGITKAGYTIITATAPSSAYTAHPVDLVVNFTKNGGGVLNDYMPNLTVELVPTVKTGLIPTVISNNSGIGQYIAKRGNAYRETVAVKVNGNTVTTFQFNVYKSNLYYTNIIADDLAMSYKDGSAWAVNLTDENGDAIPNAPVKIGVLGKFYNRVTDADGVVSLPINLNQGTYEINATFEGNNVYESSFAKATVTVNKAVAILSGDDLEMSYKDGSAWAVCLAGENGDAIPNAPVKIGVLGKFYNRVTDADGVVSLPINLNPGTYEINATFYGNNRYSPTFVSATVTVGKGIAVLSASNLVMSYKDGSCLSVTLTGANGNAIGSALVDIGIAGKVYTIKTNDSGIAKLNINLLPGTYDVSASFPNSKYESDSIIATVIVEKGVPVLTAADLVMSYNDGSVYSITLTDANGNAIANTYVKVTIGSTTYNRKTDEEGVATLPISLPIGQYNVTAKFDGDSKYDVAEISNSITVNKPVMSITAEDVNMTYKDGTSYAVQLINSEGSPVAIANEIIKITIMGKTYDRKTNSLGIATLPINLMAGTYTITAKYGENIINSTIIVN